MESALASASAITDQRQKIEQYKHILSSVISSNDIVRAKKFIDHSYLSPSPSIFLIKFFCPYALGFFKIHYFRRKQFFVGPYLFSGFKFFVCAVLSDDVPLVVSRQLLQTFAQELGRLEPETQKKIANYTLAQIQPRVVSFEEQVSFGLCFCSSYCYLCTPCFFFFSFFWTSWMAHCFCTIGPLFVCNWLLLLVCFPLHAFFLFEFLLFIVFVVRAIYGALVIRWLTTTLNFHDRCSLSETCFFRC